MKNGEKSQDKGISVRQSQKKAPKTRLKINYRWVFTMLFWSFTISVALTYISARSISSVGYAAAFLILFAFIALGVFFDIVGISAASADEKSFHSMSAKRVNGAKESVWLIRNAEKVSSFCNDVVGDISGIISGATGAVIISRIARDTSLEGMAVNLVVTGLIAALTIGGKAAGKNVAIVYSEKIIFFVGRVMSFFHILKFGGEK